MEYEKEKTPSQNQVSFEATEARNVVICRNNFFIVLYLISVCNIKSVSRKIKMRDFSNHVIIQMFLFEKGVLVWQKNQHVTPRPDGKQQVKGAGNNRATVRTSTQGEAIKIARPIALNQASELVIHRPNGQIRAKDSYGNNPFPQKGQFNRK